MKFFPAAIIGICASLSVTSFAKNNSYHQFMPDNNLWMEDSREFFTGISEAMFNTIIDAGYKTYGPLAKKNREGFEINRNWSDSTVNASCGRNFGTVTLNMYGGLARRPEVGPEAFTLVLCHELSHAYGGTPYVRASSKLSAEGQADYMATKECYTKIAAEVPELRTTYPEYDAFSQAKCQEFTAQNGNSPYDYLDCINGLKGGLDVSNLLAVLSKEKTPKYETPDTTVVSRTNLSYPDKVQCRLDTYLRGVLGQARPSCWFKN